jgi:hypothetical protein
MAPTVDTQPVLAPVPVPTIEKRVNHHTAHSTPHTAHITVHSTSTHRIVHSAQHTLHIAQLAGGRRSCLQERALGTAELMLGPSCPRCRSVCGDQGATDKGHGTGARGALPQPNEVAAPQRLCRKAGRAAQYTSSPCSPLPVAISKGSIPPTASRTVEVRTQPSVSVAFAGFLLWFFR